jgi:hypothetical protein
VIILPNTNETIPNNNVDKISDRGKIYSITDEISYRIASEALDLATENQERINELVESFENTLKFNDFSGFPNIGSDNTLYISTDENKIYRWDRVNQIYTVLMKSDIINFDTIQGIL